MMLSLEYLFFFKKMMEDSLSQDEDVSKPYLYSRIESEFKPTVTLLNLD